MLDVAHLVAVRECEPGRLVHYKPLLDEAIKLSSVKPQACIILQRPQQSCNLMAGRDHDWVELRGKAIAAKKSADCVPVLATDPLYILYTSGTTGKPKGVVRDNGGHLVALQWSMKNLYGIDPALHARTTDLLHQLIDGRYDDFRNNTSAIIIGSRKQR